MIWRVFCFSALGGCALTKRSKRPRPQSYSKQSVVGSIPSCHRTGCGSATAYSGNRLSGLRRESRTLRAL